MIYYIIFWILTVLAFLEVFTKYGSSNRILKKVVVFLVGIVLVVLAGMRNGIGIDIGSYHRDYIWIRSGSMSLVNTSLELGYSILNYVAPSFRWLLLMMAILCVGIRFRAFKKDQILFILLAVFFYYGTDFIYYDMGIMRQGLSMSICLLSLPAIEKKDKRFFIYIIVAAFFHISSLLFIAMWFISYKEYTRRFYYAWVAVAVVFFLGCVNYTGIMTKIINSIGGDYLIHKFNKYLTYNQVNLTVSFIRRIAFLILFIEAFKRETIRFSGVLLPKRQITKSTWLHINGYFLSVVLFGIFTPLFSFVAGRMTAMFYTLYIFIYCDMFRDKRQFAINFIWFLIFTLLLFETFNGSVNNTNGNYLPYMWGW